MGKHTVKLHVGRRQAQSPRTSGRSPSREGKKTTDAPLSPDLLRSYAELLSALRAAGRWMTRRAASKRDLRSLENLRAVLKRADLLIATSERVAKDAAGDVVSRARKENPVAKRTRDTSSGRTTKIVVMKKSIPTRHRARVL